MKIGGVEVDEALGLRYRLGEAAALIDELNEAQSSSNFLRALALASLGHFDEADRGFQQCEAVYPIGARVQRLLLNVTRHHELEQSLEELKTLLAKPDLDGHSLGAICHVQGIAEGKLRRTSASATALLESLRYYKEAGDFWAIAQVRDTLGTLEAARGRLEQAVHCYAMALVDKSLLGDRLGMAITLGNLGRVHLRAGRFVDAIESFERDWQLCHEMNDVRGLCRMHNDLGRTWIASGDWLQGDEELSQGVELAEKHGFKDIAFYCHKDLASLRIEQSRLLEARAELQAAQNCLTPTSAAYLQLIWKTTSGELLAAEHDRRGVVLLEESVTAFHRAELPDWEITSRIALAKALLGQREPYAAERCLLAAMRLAKANGYVRYYSVLNETMTRLDLSEGADLEAGKVIVESGEAESTVGAASSNPTSNDATGNYLIREQLGAGSFGSVYRAYDSQRGIEVALKRIHLGQAYDPTVRAALLESTKTELAGASRVRHPGVMRVYAIGHEGSGNLYICEELIVGKSLSDWMEEHSAPAIADVTSIAAGICHALEALHAVHVYHRDLKPHNVLLRSSEQPVLIDFGIAQLKSAGWFDEANFTGTLEYMAPEQSLGKSVDGRADLYALGVILYEWFTGRRPIRVPEGSWKDCAAQLQSQLPKPITIYRPDLPPAMVKLVHQLLEKKPRRRPTSAQMVADQLRQIAGESGF